jgi:hypothetical protein
LSNSDQTVPEGDQLRRLQGRVGGGPREHQTRPDDRRGQLRRGLQGPVARPLRRGRQDTQVQRPGEAQRQEGRGPQGGVPQGARDHEEAAPREARQALVCVHHRRARLHRHRVHVQRLAAQVHARGRGHGPQLQGGDRHGGADRMRHALPRGLALRAPRPGRQEHTRRRAQHRQDSRLRLRANAQLERQAGAVSGRVEQVPGEVDRAGGVHRGPAERPARLHHQVGRVVVRYTLVRVDHARRESLPGHDASAGDLRSQGERLQDAATAGHVHGRLLRHHAQDLARRSEPEAHLRLALSLLQRLLYQHTAVLSQSGRSVGEQTTKNKRTNSPSLFHVSMLV